MYEIVVQQIDPPKEWVEYRYLKTELGAKVMVGIYTRDYYREPEHKVFWREVTPQSN
jgi:hypothetical protein